MYRSMGMSCALLEEVMVLTRGAKPESVDKRR